MSNIKCQISNVRRQVQSLRNRLHPSPLPLYPNRGFTLIELVVVVAILAIIGTVFIVSLNPVTQFQKSQDSKRKSDLSQIQKALESYYNDQGRYPASNTNKIYVTESGGTSKIINWGDAWSPYMTVLPKDANPTKYYVYYSPDRNTYYLYASLDRGVKDPQVCNGGLKCANVPAGVNCGTSASKICNYGVSSPNVSP